MKESNRINALQNYRYGITSAYNDGFQVPSHDYSIAFYAGQTWELAMNLTYEQINDALKQHFGLGEGDEPEEARLQSYRNHHSTLNAFLASVGKTLASRIGAELGSGFDQALRDYFTVIDVSQRTKRDRRSHLQLVRKLNDDLTKGRNQKPAVETALSVELRNAIARTGLAPKTLAKSVSLSTSAMQRWLKGAMPNQRGMPTLRRLEKALDLPRDHLVNLVKPEKSPSTRVVSDIPFRRGQLKQQQDHYYITESALSQAFLGEWRELFDYKTTQSPSLKRKSKCQWRCVGKEATNMRNPLVQRGNAFSSAAAIVLEQLRAYFGALPRLGDGAYKDAPMTLAWLADSAALNAYLQWITDRSDGKVHQRQKVFCQNVAALVRPIYGYLWQRPELGEHLPPQHRPESVEAWQAMCSEALKVADTWKGLVNGTSRDTSEPISFLLEQPNLMAPMLQCIDDVEQAAAEAPPSSLSEALLHRDALLLAMFLANPLRLRTMMSLTWAPDGSGTLRGSAKTGWRIHLKPHHQKNGARNGGRDYDVRLADWLIPMLNAYLEEYRTTILGDSDNPYLFVSRRSTEMWTSMPDHFRKLTRKFLQGSPGFGPHSVRDLVATHWLREFPNDFLTVAELLNDRLETVMTHYAHLKKDTSFLRYEQHLERLRAGHGQ